MSAPDEFAGVAEALLTKDWIFAKTMPRNPHWYTLRKKWAGEVSFDDVVEFIRVNGYQRNFGGRPYSYLALNGMEYWSMGAPIPETILINRAAIKGVTDPHDTIAAVYDEAFASPEDEAEEFELVCRIGYDGGTLLDIGCGTGMLLKHVVPERYIGIDPSKPMLSYAKTRATGFPAQLIQTRLEDFWVAPICQRVVSLFGSLNYVESDRALGRVPSFVAPGGRFLLVLYREGYTPRSHELNPELEARFVDPDLFEPCSVEEWGNYLIVEGER